MDGFFSWARNFSYDIVALLLPGFLFIVCFAYISVGSMPIDLLSGDIDKTVDKGFLMVASYMLASYITGIALKWFASLPRVRRLYRKNLDSYGPVYADLYELAKDKVQDRFKLNGINSWCEFYLLVKTYVHKESIPSTLATYQNRYEFSSSLSCGFLLLGVVQSCLTAIRGIDDGCAQLSAIIQDSGLAIIFFFLAFVLYKSFRKYWVELGSQTIAQALILDD
ncbi:MAG: hypothetical protein Tsb002_00510 [Wenzhouxiangellaceae bacterium]